MAALSSPQAFSNGGSISPSPVPPSVSVRRARPRLRPAGTPDCQRLLLCMGLFSIFLICRSAGSSRLLRSPKRDQRFDTWRLSREASFFVDELSPELATDSPRKPALPAALREQDRELIGNIEIFGNHPSPPSEMSTIVQSRGREPIPNWIFASPRQARRSLRRRLDGASAFALPLDKKAETLIRKTQTRSSSRIVPAIRRGRTRQ
jgi:hypothetical protein